MEDDRVSLLEQQLAQAKLIAEEADKKYEEVGHEPANEKAIFSRQSYGSQSVFILTNHDPLYHFLNKFLFDIFYIDEFSVKLKDISGIYSIKSIIVFAIIFSIYILNCTLVLCYIITHFKTLII